ncbi:MAG: DUF4450 domain-containing protein [Prolixibacteraceae bacterium]
MNQTAIFSLFLFFLFTDILVVQISGQNSPGTMKLHYLPVDNGYQIVGGNNIFNRGLYGGHKYDYLPEKYFTLAGDRPIILSAISDWKKSEACLHAKCGTFMAGIAYTPGVRAPIFRDFPLGKFGDRYSEWFHESESTVATYKNGWMEYEISPFFQCFPRVTAKIEVLPIDTENGFLVHLQVQTDQRVNFVMGFGGITDFIGSLQFPCFKARNFSPSDCLDNTITVGKNSALVSGSEKNSIKTSMRIGASFPVNAQIGDARKVEYPGLFLENDSVNVETPMIRMDCAIKQGEILDGYIVVLRNATEAAMDKWLSFPNPVEYLKNEIRKIRSAIEISTPDNMLDLTVPPSVLAMDASWHEKSFYHGTYGWHAPYMGWRLWYGPTVIGWHDRVQKNFKTFANQQVIKNNKTEEVIYNGDAFSKLKNSYGFLPEISDGRNTIFYNMQEVGVDMILHEIEWTGNLSYADSVFNCISDVLDWEKRILDPDNDHLYQNWLNTWISDAHSYNGGGCAQSSAYNYRANKVMANLASRLGRNPEPFLSRSKKIQDAVQKTLWIPEKGVMAEYIDVIGNKLLHPSPELATIYHSIETGTVDPFQAYQMLAFTEKVLRNEKTKARGGRLVWSSNWYPQNYSSCGLYAAENIHLAWAYFMCGQTQKGHELLKGIVDAHFLSRYPGIVAHCLTPDGYSDGDSDFTDVSSMYLRLMVEGLFGIRFNLLDDKILVAPNFPSEWEHARLKIADASLEYQRKGQKEIFYFQSDATATKVYEIPLCSTKIERVLVNGHSVNYRIEPGIGFSKLIVESKQPGNTKVEVNHASIPIPKLKYQHNVAPGELIDFAVDRGLISEIKDPSGCLSDINQDKAVVNAKVKGSLGNHTVFIHVKEKEWDGWLVADITIDEKQPEIKPVSIPVKNYNPVDISKYFNISLTEIHKQEYWKPRPEGYSIMANFDGRFGWDWNHAGYRGMVVDDNKLRSSGGKYFTDNGIPFSTPEKGSNVACISVWKNFPEETFFNLSGKGNELAVLFIGVTNPMQSRVENARFTVEYTDGTKEKVSLINPVNFDDWLVASVQQENETEYFSDFNHGIVQRIPLNPDKELKSFHVRAVANEVIVGILGISIQREKSN